jgi:hypothetical protein
MISRRIESGALYRVNTPFDRTSKIEACNRALGNVVGREDIQTQEISSQS